jgi:type VI protein secretion system component Hcp
MVSLVLGMARLASGTEAAATDLFLTWPGIFGNSQALDHKGDIELISYSQNASGPAGTGPKAIPASCGQITIRKQVDSTSPVFLGMVLSGQVTTGTPAPVVFTFAKPTGNTGGLTPFYTVTLRNVVPTSITQSDSQGDDTIVETIILSASQFVFTFTPQLPTGASGTPISFGFDCAADKPL